MKKLLISLITLSAIAIGFQNCGSGFESRGGDYAVISGADVLCDTNNCVQYQENYFYEEGSEVLPSAELVNFNPNYNPSANSSSSVQNSSLLDEAGNSESSETLAKLHVVAAWVADDRQQGQTTSVSSATYGTDPGITRKQAIKFCDDHIIYSRQNPLYSGRADHFLCVYDGRALKHQPGLDNILKNFCGNSCDSLIQGELAAVLEQLEPSQTRPASTPTTSRPKVSQTTRSDGTSTPSSSGDSGKSNVATCDTHDGAGGRLLLSSDGPGATRYVPAIYSGTSSSQGRYAIGVNMYCEKQEIRCSVTGRISGRTTQARLLANRDKGLCNENLFQGHPEYTYSQYREWFKFIEGRYQACKSRQPTEEEVATGIHSLLELNQSTNSLAGQICGNTSASGSGGNQESACTTASQKNMVTSLYTRHLGREPDLAGLNFYCAILDGGQSITVVSDDIRRSPECKTACL